MSRRDKVFTIGGPQTESSRYYPEDLSKEELDKKLTDVQNDWEGLQINDLSSSDYYFNSYAHFGIHEEMLKDTVRTGAYARAISGNPHLFRDKIVLDVGTGTGILSMLAAKAGAKHVYAIECSDIIHLAQQLICQNHLEDKITLIQAKAEDAVLPVDRVDVIISEWMGYFLLYESMLDTVLFCRDQWLRPDGIILPDRATLHLAAIEDEEYSKERFDYWDNCFGLDFSCVKGRLREEPTIDIVHGETVCTDVCCILDLDLKTCKVDDLNFAAPFKIKFHRKDFAHAVIAWFDCSFTACHVPVTFSTGPFGYNTHWKQTVFYLVEPILGQKDESIVGYIAVRKSAKNHRDLDIKLTYHFDGQTSRGIDRRQYYRLR